MQRWSQEVQNELYRISVEGERDALWDHCLIDDRLMTMRFECRPHHEDCDGRYTYFCEAFPVTDALRALKELPEGYGIDRAVWDVLFKLPGHVPHELSEPMISALAEAEGNAFNVCFSPESQTPEALSASPSR